MFRIKFSPITANPMSPISDFCFIYSVFIFPVDYSKLTFPVNNPAFFSKLERRAVKVFHNNIRQPEWLSGKEKNRGSVKNNHPSAQDTVDG